jgi:hypothetical protein
VRHGGIALWRFQVNSGHAVSSARMTLRVAKARQKPACRNMINMLSSVQQSIEICATQTNCHADGDAKEIRKRCS